MKRMSPQDLPSVSTAFSPELESDNNINDSCDDWCDKQEIDSKLDTFTTSDIIFLIYYYGLLVLLSAVSVSGNGIILYGMVKHRHLRVPGNYFIFSLACSDFSLGLIYPVYNVSHIETDGIKNTLGIWGVCDFLITLTLGMLSISAFNLVGITITRFISIRDPLQFSSKVTHQRALVWVLVVWIAIGMLSVLLYVRPYPPEEYESVCRYEMFLDLWHIIFTLVFSVLLPLVIMTALYMQMTHLARKQVRIMAQQELSVRRDITAIKLYIFKKELKLFRMAGLLLGYFCFAWIPFVIFEFVYITCRIETSTPSECEVDRYIRATVRLLLHSNTAVNVIIYGSRMTEFRQVFLRDLRSCYCICRKSANTVRPGGAPTVSDVPATNISLPRLNQRSSCSTSPPTSPPRPSVMESTP